MNSKVFSTFHSKRETLLRNSRNKNTILKSSKKPHEIIEEIDASINTSAFPILFDSLESLGLRKYDFVLSFSESLLASKKKTEYQPLLMNSKILDFLLEIVKQDNHPFLQYKALLILEALLEEKSKFHAIFLDKIDIQHFLSLLKSSDSLLKKHTLIIIHYIINGSPESHDILSNFGLVNYLITNIKEKDENFQLAITTLGNILAASMVDRIYIKEGLPSLCWTLAEDNKGQILGFLRRIINKADKEYIEILRECGILSTLINLFINGTNSTSLQQSHVVKIIGHMFQENERDIINFLETPRALDSINELLQSPLELKKRLGFWLLLRVITRQSIDYLFVSPAVLVTVFQMSQSGSWKMQKNASLIFVKIVEMASDEHTRFILEKYGIRVIYSIQPLLDITLPELEEHDVVQALKAIIKIFEFKDTSESFLDPTFLEEIQNILQILHSYKNEEISLLSQKIMEKIATFDTS